MTLRPSFKRKPTKPSALSLSGFLSPLPRLAENLSNTPLFSSTRAHRLREQASQNPSDISLVTGNGRAHQANDITDTKDGLDWYVGGFGRRAGYDDLTAIDWIFEYTKERQRLRLLYSRATGLLGQAQQLFDASQIWLVLIATGLASGVLAAGIDVVSTWLGDLREGYCKNNAEGGQFYLNLEFCCWGHEGTLP